MIDEKGQDFAPEAAPSSALATVSARVAAPAEGALEQIWGCMFLSPERAAPKSIVVTSAEPREGVSQIAAALALIGSSSEHGLRVALVDFNLHRPTIPKLFQIRPAPGVVDVLRGEVPLSAATVRASGFRLTLLPPGERKNVTLSLLRSDRVGEMIRELARDHDHVIIDAPAVNRSPIPPILAAFADGVVIVTKAGMTRRESVAEAKKRIELARGKVLGVILNRREYPIPRFLYDRL